MQSESTSEKPEGRAIYRLIKHALADERIRFLLIGGINTAVGFGLFVVLQLTLGGFLGYLGSLYVSYAVATIVAFVLHRRFTFQVRSTGRIFVDLIRFQMVYLLALAINTGALPLLVEVFSVPPIPAQAMITVVTMVLSYVGHKWFSFRRARVIEPGEGSPNS